jgi:hypothetical protein
MTNNCVFEQFLIRTNYFSLVFTVIAYLRFNVRLIFFTRLVITYLFLFMKCFFLDAPPLNKLAAALFCSEFELAPALTFGTADFLFLSSVYL